MKIISRFFPYDDVDHEWPQIVLIFIVSLSSFTTGALFTWTSPSIPVLISNSSHIGPITMEEASYFSVIPPIAVIALGPIVAHLLDRIGRRRMIVLISVPQILSWLLIVFANDVRTLYVSRFVEGVGEAIMYNALPMYVGEIATPSVRGSWGNVVNVAINFGQFVVNVIGSYCDIRTTACILICAPVAALALELALGLPESPYFLLMKGRAEEAGTSLRTLRWNDRVENELAGLAKDVDRQISEMGTYKDLFVVPSNRRALTIAIGLRILQKMNGFGAFMVYTQYLFEQAGSDLSATTSSIVFNGCFLIVNAAATTVTEKYGRRRLLIFSNVGCSVALAIEAVYFYVREMTDRDVGQFNWVPLAGMILYILMCGSGMSTLPALVLSELFSTSVKGKALFLTNMFLALGVMASSKLFQTLETNFGMFAPFCLFTACSVLGVAFCYVFVIETKGKTLEEIQQELKKPTLTKFANANSIRPR